jgi:hypothetical protein
MNAVSAAYDGNDGAMNKLNEYFAQAHSHEVVVAKARVM